VLTAGGFYVASFRPAVRAAPTPGAGGRWIFWLDTSASGADGGEHREHAMQQVLAALPAGDVVELRAFDHRVTVLGQGTAAQMSARVAGLLAARRYLGGTDLEAVIRDVAAAARQPGAARLVVQTDGVATLGATDPAALRTAAAALPAGATVHALVLGARQDAPTLRTLTAGRGRVVVVPFSDSLDARARDAARRLRMPPGATFTASDAGAEWIHTVGADDVLPGDEVLVVGRVRAGGRAAPVLAGAGGPIAAGAAQALEAGSFAPLLEREAYRGYIDELVERASRTTDDSTRQALAREQVRVSVEHRVLSPLTTLLVLETERDYGRFGLDRRALAEILAVGDDGIIRADRQPPPATVASSDASAAADTVARDVDDRTEHVQPRVVRRVRESSQGAEAADRASADASAPLALQSVVVAGAASGNAQSVSARETPSPAPMAPPLPPPAPMAPPVPPPAPEPMPIVVPPPAPSGHGAASGPAEMPEWTTPVPASAARVDSLRTRLRAAPRDREVRNQLADALWMRGQWQELRTLALDWQPYDPENPQVYEALGEADVHLGRVQEAERALGSLVEVADGKPELLQRAGLLLLRVNAARLAETPLRTALAQRPDRVNGYRHLALMLWQSGRFAEAARVLEDASRRDFPGWYGDARRVVKEELGYVLRAWMAHEPARAASIRGEAAEYGVDLDRRDALRVTLAWETDANDVDLHVVDPAGEEAYYAHQNTALGLDLYEDITRGFGPEVVRTAKVHAGDYPIGVTYFSAGPMGVSRGIVVVIRGDGPGAPVAQIFPFRLIEGNSAEVRHVATIHVGRR
ncbi:MAG TPA: hypothetical protein VFH27_18360, partial [Longimicrobiaceae bacterium]|nr:hypothetical protein [Longimicrobiaceae bacterium]